MKKIVSILVLVFAFTFTSKAQEKRKEKGPELTVEQYTNLGVKKMTLALDLSKKQQIQIKPLISEQAASKKAAILKRETKKKPSANEIYEMKSKQLDNQIAFKSKMKNILNNEQFEKFEKMKKARKERRMKMMNRKKIATTVRRLKKERKEKE